MAGRILAGHGPLISFTYHCSLCLGGPEPAAHIETRTPRSAAGSLRLQPSAALEEAGFFAESPRPPSSDFEGADFESGLSALAAFL